MTKQVEFYARLPIKFKKRAHWYLASCPVLDVHSQGITRKEAERNLKEALGLFLTSCFERSVLDQVLKDCGFKLSTHGKLTRFRNTIVVPIPLAIETSESVKCPA